MHLMHEFWAGKFNADNRIDTTFFEGFVTWHDN